MLVVYLSSDSVLSFTSGVPSEVQTTVHKTENETTYKRITIT